MSDEQQNRVKADVMQIALLKEISDCMHALIPDGIIEPLPPITITTVPRTITPPSRKAWFSMSIVNDGPNDCWIVVNSEISSTTPYNAKVGEVYEVDVGAAKIVDIIAHCDTGTANLRIKGIR